MVALGRTRRAREAVVARTGSLKSAVWFCLGLLVLAPVCLVVWGLLLPLYADVLGVATSVILRIVFGFPVEDVTIKAEGLFNTRTLLTYTIAGREPAMNV